MAATRASGTNAARYGTMRENVLGLQVVVASAEIIRTGTRAKKSSADYDLTRQHIGSEGTRGVMTEITLKLYPLPEAVSAVICQFPTIDATLRTAIQTIQLGLPIARCELLDANAIRAVNKHPELTLREASMLLMEFHGSPRLCGIRRRRSRRSHARSAAKTWSGPARPKNARGCGRRGTRATSRRCR